MNSTARKIYFILFFFPKHLVWVRMCTQVVGADTDLSLGWRPAARAALAARPWETGGRHPNVITAAKLLSIKAKLQKYVPWGLRTMKTERRLSGCCLRSAVEVVLRCVWWDLLWARNSRFHSCWQTSGCTCGFPCGNYYGGQPHHRAMLLFIKPDSKWMCHLQTIWWSTRRTVGYTMRPFVLMTCCVWTSWWPVIIKKIHYLWRCHVYFCFTISIYY